jgi:hypothetical protein
MREDALRAFALIGAPCPNIVMAGHSRPKDSVASARLCPAIHVFLVTAQ